MLSTVATDDWQTVSMWPSLS